MEEDLEIQKGRLFDVDPRLTWLHFDQYYNGINKAIDKKEFIDYQLEHIWEYTDRNPLSELGYRLRRSGIDKVLEEIQFDDECKLYMATNMPSLLKYVDTLAEERKKQYLKDDGTYIWDWLSLSMELQNGVAIAEYEAFLRYQLSIYEDTIPNQAGLRKLKWKGTPAQFGYIIDLLIQGGYLEKPTSSFQKDASFYLQHFEIDTQPTTLNKEVSEKTNSLSVANRKKISIPHRDKLD